MAIESLFAFHVAAWFMEVDSGSGSCNWRVNCYLPYIYPHFQAHLCGTVNITFEHHSYPYVQTVILIRSSLLGKSCKFVEIQRAKSTYSRKIHL